MNLERTIIGLVIGLSLLSSGCASLHPPAQDKAAWEEQQKQQEAQKESEMQHDPLGIAFYYAWALFSVGYGASGGK
jgi:hypothetical protein